MSNIKSTKSPVGRCPITNKPRDPEDLERDFTTPGKIGDLECPFAKMAQNGRPDTPNSHDPIAAEFHQDHSSVASQGPLGKCPIRFLDKHSPEEIAQYFENHKHEIPRSHAVCVKRYQRNEDSIRALDAKYGNMVNMIQGLGVKHKQYLPSEDKVVDQEASSNAAVERWTEDVSQKSIPPEPEAQEEPRVSHFERPLREVRVGESPSRPWGISVPVDKEIPPSAMESEANQAEQHVQSGIRTPPAPDVVGVPQSLLKPKSQSKPQQTAHAKSSVNREQSASRSPPQQIIFNGPVFFGYSADDTAKLLRNLNVSGLQPPSS